MSGDDSSIIVKTGYLEQENVDVILNVTRRDLQLDCRGLSTAILNAAGDIIQMECTLGHRELLKPGEIFVTSSGSLPSKAIFHGYCVKWDNGECLRELMSNALKEARDRKYTSIAFPAIGTGKLHYPPAEVARLMLLEVQYSRIIHPVDTPQDIRIVIYRKDPQTIKEFSNAIKEYLNESSSDSCIDDKDNDTRTDTDKHTNIGSLQNCEVPGSLTPMASGTISQMVELDEDSDEHIDVAKRFNQGTIISIRRIDNTQLYEHYQYLKGVMENLNPGIDNEMILYHGTAVDSLHNINNTGFNRSYCGKNATVFGDGVYFAVDPKYSAQEIYSPPDSEGNRYIYQVRVLVGKSTEGEPGMKEPPLLPDLSGKRHDSVYGYNRKVFVVFKDGIAYPEYLITFT